MLLHAIFKLFDQAGQLASIHMADINRSRCCCLAALALAFFARAHGAGLENIGDFLADGAGRNTMLPIVGLLLLSAALGFIHRPLHRAGDPICVEYRLAIDIAGGATHGLDEGAIRAQEALLVCIENRHQ